MPWSGLSRWLAVLAWMAFIFVGSTDLLASHRTSRFIGPILRWFNPNVSEATIARVQMVVRKTGHLTEYGILAVLLARALQPGSAAALTPGAWRLAMGLCVLYACADEFHQAFEPSRQASVGDVLLDTAGGVLGLLWLGWWRRRRPPA